MKKESYVLTTAEGMILFNEQNCKTPSLFCLAAQRAIRAAIARNYPAAFATPGIRFAEQEKILADVKNIFSGLVSPATTEEFLALRTDEKKIESLRKKKQTSNFCKKILFSLQIWHLKGRCHNLQEVLRGLAHATQTDIYWRCREVLLRDLEDNIVINDNEEI